MIRDKRQEPRVEGRNQSFWLRSRSGSRLSVLDSRLPRGVTLIELMITIMIIGILAAAVLGVAAVAGETAREAKTRTIISRIHTLLMEQYDSYVNRRVKLQANVLQELNSSSLNATTAQRGRLKAEARLDALREMMLMEIPDRWSDVLLRDIPEPPDSTAAAAAPPLYLDAPLVNDPPYSSKTARTELGDVYLRIYRRIASATNKITNSQNTRQNVVDNQGAECLYMVIMNACGDGESRTLFPESSIGDVDGDGAPEFIDGWGHPIEFLRWAPGFESDIQQNAMKLDTPESGSSDEAWQAAGASDHDPFDLYRAHPRAYRLIPLVVSRGRDEELGLITAPDLPIIPWRTTTGSTINLLTNFSVAPPYVTPALNPYVNPSPGYLGAISADGKSAATDNITNHLIGTR